MGAVKEVSPWRWLQTMPLATSLCRTVAIEGLATPKVSAIWPVAWGPGPSSAIARRYFCSRAVSRSEAHAEEAAVEVLHHLGRCGANHFAGDGGLTVPRSRPDSPPTPPG